MIFRYLFRIQQQRFHRRFMPPDYCKDLLESGGYDYISDMSEWFAFRALYFPMSVIREMDPKHLRELQRLTREALANTEANKE